MNERAVSGIKCALGKLEADLLIAGGSVLNVFTDSLDKADIAIKDGRIVSVGACTGIFARETVDASGKVIVPSFIDGHVHLESSLISPSQYARVVLPHGTCAVVADPHEIANVLGMRGIEYMLNSTEGLALDVYFTAPSCVPATPIDESGAEISAKDIRELLSHPRVVGLAEMMNYPGVLASDGEVMDKLSAALESGSVIDGHAPSLSGQSLDAYIFAGVRSDHECTSSSEAIEKLSRGQWIMIREGTACKNLLSLLPLFKAPYSARCMLVTDDKHPLELKTEGHIDHAVRLAIRNGADPVSAYKMASFNPAVYFGFRNNGAIAPGYNADLILLDDLDSVSINCVFRRGVRVSELTKSIGASACGDITETVKLGHIDEGSFEIKKPREKIIELTEGEILTRDGGYAEGMSPENGICKISVIERHGKSGNIGTAYLSGYGILHGAVATSIAHDSHNIIVAGASEADMALAVRRIAEMGGGMAVADGGKITAELALPIAGLMCDSSAESVGEALAALKAAAYSLGISRGIDPFMTLSFASLPVIPELRITTHGVFDVRVFKLI